MNSLIKAQQMDQVGELQENERRTMDRRVIINFSVDQLRRVGVQVAEHFLRDDKEGALQLLQTYNLSSQGHYQIIAFAMQRLYTYDGHSPILFIDWLAGIHLN